MLNSSGPKNAFRLQLLHIQVLLRQYGVSSPKVGVHDEEEEEEINNDLVVAALGDSWSSWRPPRAPKAVGALPMLFIALLVAPPISSTGHCSCASQVASSSLKAAWFLAQHPCCRAKLCHCRNVANISQSLPFPRKKENRSSFKSHFLCTIVHNSITLTKFAQILMVNITFVNFSSLLHYLGL